MSGTDAILDGPTGELAKRLRIPPPVATVCLRGLRAFRVLDDDGEPILLVSDGETTVEFACGIVGHSGATALGAQRLVEAVMGYASMLEESATGGVKR